MAVSLMRIGRLRTLKNLQQEAWGLPSISQSAALSTKSVDPKKGRTKNVVAPEERARLVASKAAVEFPKKLPLSRPPAAATGETIASIKSGEVLKITDEERGQFLSKKTSVEFPCKILTVPAPLNKKLQEQADSPEEKVRYMAFKSLVEFPKHESWSVLAAGTSMAKEPQDHSATTAVVGEASTGVPDKLEDKKSVDKEDSSSSSDSDSSSDSESDSDDEETVADITIKTKVEFPKRESFSQNQGSFSDETLKWPHTEETLTRKSKKAPATKVPSRTKETSSRSDRQTEPSKTVTATHEIKGVTELSAVLPQQEMQTEHGIIDLETKEREELSETKPKTTVKEIDKLPVEVISHKQTKFQQVPEVNPEHGQTMSVKEEATPQETQGRVEHTMPKAMDEVLGDKAPVIKADAGEQIITEATFQTQAEGASQEPEAAQESSQQEFDISTYKNLQHHSFTPFTFVDFELELSRFRQPQPSSRKESPRH